MILTNGILTVKFEADGRHFTVMNSFGKVFKCRLDDRGKVEAKSVKGLVYALRARAALGF